MFKQNPVLIGYSTEFELYGILKSGYYESPLGVDNVVCIVIEVLKLENQMNFYFRNTEKDIIMTEEDDEETRYTNKCQFCEKKYKIW